MVAGKFLFPGEEEPRECKVKKTVIESVEGGEVELRRFKEAIEQAGKDWKKAVHTSSAVGIGIGMAINLFTAGKPI
jgi:hypothetical protein